MYSIELNTSIPYNYSFYCPISNISLNSFNKLAFVEELTPSMKRSIYANTLISKEIMPVSVCNESNSNDGKEEVSFGIEVKSIKEEVKEAIKEEIVEVKEEVKEEIKEEIVEVEEEKPKKDLKEEKPKSKKGKKKKTTTKE